MRLPSSGIQRQRSWGGSGVVGSISPFGPSFIFLLFPYIKAGQHGVEAEKGSGWRRPIRGFVTSTYSLESGKQKCLKSEYGAMGHSRRDRAKKEK